MKKTITFVLALMVFCMPFFFSSCDLETSHNGDLDGLWHLTSIDTLSTGGVKDVSEELLFMAVQHDLLELSNRENMFGCFFRFSKSDSTLFIFEPYINSREFGDPALTDPSRLHIFGIQTLETLFDIEKLSSGKMILNDNTMRLHFKKM